MNFKFTIKYLLACVFLVPAFLAHGQLSEGGEPWSFSAPGMSKSFQHISLAPPDGDQLVEEDGMMDEFYRAERFAVLLPVGVTPVTAGTWESLPGGGRLWRLKVSAEGSLASSLYFTDFKLPPGVKLFVYAEDGYGLIGAFTHNNNKENGLFATSLIYSDRVVIELNVPSNTDADDWFTLSEVTYAYDDTYFPDEVKGFGTSQFCEVNVNCSPEGDGWKDEKNGIVRLQVKVNTNAYWCSGSMINNTKMDKAPYLLTADHCAYKFGQYATADDLATWLFYFRYESIGCANPTLEPQHFSMTGCEKVAQDGTHGMDGSDFYLVKLLDDIPMNYNVYFNGWSTMDVPSSSGVTIHHPDGDIKKISTYTETPESSEWQSNGLESHWKVVWAETANNWGVTEGGSSGAPLFDNIGRIVGTLTGGLASCNNPGLPDYYGKFSYHWESNGDHDTTQLRPWLDPLNSGVVSLTGMTMGELEHNAEKPVPVRAYPNPVREELHLVFLASERDPVSIELLDPLGHVLHTAEVPAFQSEYRIVTGNLMPGVYFIRYSGKAGTRSLKIIKSE